MASGFGWGIGSVTFGLGCAYVGDSLAFAIILGLCATLGTAIPMLILKPEDATKKVGIYTWAGIGVVCIGLYLLAKAGASKERDQKALKKERDSEKEPLMKQTSINSEATTSTNSQEKSFAVGLFICLLSGVFSGLMNVGLTLGKQITDAAEERGASSICKKNLTWALVISSGFLPNAAYSMYLLSKNSTWSYFGNGSLGVRLYNIFLGAMMGILWYVGNFIYGAGASGIGLLGTVVGWPVFMVCSLNTSASMPSSHLTIFLH